MMVDFEKIFNPTPEEQLECLETAMQIHNAAIEKKWCTTCKHWTAPPDNLPGFVEDHGDCDCDHTVDTVPNCPDYAFDEAREHEEYSAIRSRIDMLKELVKQKNAEEERETKTFREGRVLKPCPFCGKYAIYSEDQRFAQKPEQFPKWYVVCQGCNIQTPVADIRTVTTMWNKRVYNFKAGE